MKRLDLKNIILNTSAIAAAGVYLGSGMYLIDPRYITTCNWKAACTGMAVSGLWMWFFLMANPRYIEKLFMKVFIAAKKFYEWYKRKIKKLCRWLLRRKHGKNKNN